MTANVHPKTRNMASENDKLDRKKQEAISALLVHPTIEKAAQAVGIREKTLWRWLQIPEFDSAYEEARNRVLAQTIGLLHKATGVAVTTLMKNLKCGVPSVEVRAAVAVLDQTFRAREILELEARLNAIEEMLKDHQEFQGSQGRFGHRR